jgi:lipopolysaccharide export system protein LptC
MSNRTGRDGNPLGGYWISGALLILVTAATALLLVRTTVPGAMDMGSRPEPREPDARMTDARIRQFDQTGTLTYVLAAPSIAFYREEGRAEIDAPALELRQRTDRAWNVRARRGVLTGVSVGGDGDDRLLLEGDVVLQPSEPDRPGRLTTARLLLYTERQYAETDQAVMIDAEGSRTAAAGLQGDLQGGSLKLFSTAERPVQTILLPDRFR